jgi:hypothetical protein
MSHQFCSKFDRATGYQLIELKPEFGFSHNQRVAMKVHKINNETVVDIIAGSDIQANDRALQSIKLSLPPDAKTGSIKGDQHSVTTSHPQIFHTSKHQRTPF